MLAEWFVAGAVRVDVEVVAVDGVEIELPEEPASIASVQPTGAGGEMGVGTIARSIWPPLRRWASAFLVEREPARWRSLLDAAGVLPSRDGDALAAGVMDSARHVASRDRHDVVAAGLGWGSGIVRLAALPAYADLEGIDAALTRAATDPSAKVRAWTPNDSRSAPRSQQADGADARAADARAMGQASLF